MLSKPASGKVTGRPDTGEVRDAWAQGHLTGDVGRIAEAAGAEAALKIAVALRGQMIYVNSIDALFREARNSRIRRERKGGMSAQKLAVKYGISMRAVRLILKEQDAPMDRKLTRLIERICMH